MKQRDPAPPRHQETQSAAANSGQLVAAADSPRQIVQMKRIAQLQADGQALEAPAQQDALPDSLKSGVEALSGVSMDDVTVHYNSPEPDKVQALAYAQGTEIHLGPGQEKHLPHEAWHIVQQKQGRVSPTRQEGSTAVNDNPNLEREATDMGTKALSLPTGGAAIQRKSNRQDKTMQKACKHCGYEKGHAPSCTPESREAAKQARLATAAAQHDQSMDNRTRRDQSHPLHGKKKSGAPKAWKNR